MKDREFIELLNLYIDHEISPENAARLETAVRTDPRRRETYLQYCRMQKACVRFAEQQAASAPEAADRKIEAFPVARAGWGQTVWAGGLLAGAAAACALVVFAVHHRGPAGEPVATVAVAPPPAAVKASRGDEFTVAPAASAPVELTTVFTARPEVPAVGERSSDGLFTVSLAAPGQFNWLSQPRYPRDGFVQPVDLTFSPPSKSAPAPAVLSSPQSAPSEPTATEMTAFKIAK